MHSTRRAEAASPPARSALRRFAVAAVIPLCACGTLVRVIDKDGAPVAGARVANWTFHGDTAVTDDEGYARLLDGWVGLAWTLQPSEIIVHTANGVFHVPYPLPDPIRLPIVVTPAPVEPTPVEPALVEPAPVEPTPVEPGASR